MCGPGCGGKAADPAPMTALGRRETPGDDTVYRVFYFNGTYEDVVGLDAARQRVMNPASRADDTDRDGNVGGTYRPAP